MGLYGWLPDREPHLDKHIDRLFGVVAPPPPAFDLRDTRAIAPAYNQVRNDCTANSIARLLQVLHTPAGATMPGPMFSRNFLYFEGGVPDGIQLQDSGRYPGSVIDAASMLGCPTEDVWPYDDRWAKHPGGEAFRQAYDFRLGKYRIPAGAALQDGIMRAISSGLAVTLGSGVSQAWEDQDGKTPFNGDPNDPDLGGHEYTGIAYDLGGTYFFNSWDTSWANGGVGYLAWAWLAAKVTDALVLTLEAQP